MISSIRIQGFRGFRHFQMTDLGRVNLLVGTNNSGKTSVLEAIHLQATAGDPIALWQMLWRRGEQLPSAPLQPQAERPLRHPQLEMDLSHLFYGHEAQRGANFTIVAEGRSERRLEYRLEELSPKDQAELFGADDDGALASRLVMEIKGVPRPALTAIPLTRSGGMYAESLEVASRRGRLRNNETSSSYFVSAESLTGDELIAIWNRLSLTPSEELVLQALRFLEPKIERIAVLAPSGYGSTQARGGFIVKHSDFDQPVPIGSMGDGMWRILALAMALTQCKGGVLLVDEIDTGLHYSVMSKMWKLVFGAAKEFDVQVFATTHSYDCVYSLAQIGTDGSSENAITVQRIEQGKTKSVPYDQDEITSVAEREIEVR